MPLLIGGRTQDQDVGRVAAALQLLDEARHLDSVLELAHVPEGMQDVLALVVAHPEV